MFFFSFFFFLLLTTVVLEYNLSTAAVRQKPRTEKINKKARIKDIFNYPDILNGRSPFSSY